MICVTSCLFLYNLRSLLLFLSTRKKISQEYCFEMRLWFLFLLSAGKEFLFLFLFLSARKEFSEGYCFELRLWFFFICTERIFREDIVLSCTCDFVLLSARKEFCVCDRYIFFCVCVCVTTITLEKLNQSEPNFYTWLLSRKLGQVRKWASQVTCNTPNRGFSAPLKINIPPISTNPSQIFTHGFWLE